MAISLRGEHLKRYIEIGRLLVKYGRSDLVRDAGMEEILREEGEPLPEAAAEHGTAAGELADDLERLGPTYIKLGQLLSTRADLLPEPYVEALARLQDDVAPFPYAEVERIVTTELGVRMSKAFSDFDPEPLAAASLGQVHRARLRDGTEVAVKVQRPGIREQIVTDLDALEDIADFLDRHTEAGRRYGAADLLTEFRRTLLSELDYRTEAQNLSTLGENLRDFTRIAVPCAVADYTTSRVLTMGYVAGRKVTQLSPLARMEMDGAALAEELFRAYLKQILVDGFFHADPHPGNVFITPDFRIGLIDVGMVGRVAPEMQERLLKLLLSVSEGRGEEAADTAIRIGSTRTGMDEARFTREVVTLVTGMQGATARNIQVGRIVMEMTRAAAENGILLPAELSTLGKTLFALDQVGRTLDPDFDPNASIRRNAAEIMRQRMLKQASPAAMFSTLLETNELVQRLPRRLNTILDNMAENQFRIEVDAIDERQLMAGLQKIANRITLGLVLAALILGAALLMRVETTFRILGYPGLAMLLFLAAVVGCVLLVLNIVLHDEHSGRK
ncbi:MAG TPA: AarF/UbiB family protein [Longimicrobiaceae bacterium]|jgi:predicted unusual protein kinase regulating ubiquinone biosynthesis (AarF/ABC1/UbiB family)